MPTNHSQRSFPERKDSLSRVHEHLKGRRRPISTKRKQHSWNPGPQVRKSGDEKTEDPSGPAGTGDATTPTAAAHHRRLAVGQACAEEYLTTNVGCGEDTINSTLHSSRKVNSTQFVKQANGEIKT